MLIQIIFKPIMLQNKCTFAQVYTQDHTVWNINYVTSVPWEKSAPLINIGQTRFMTSMNQEGNMRGLQMSVVTKFVKKVIKNGSNNNYSLERI